VLHLSFKTIYLHNTLFCVALAVVASDRLFKTDFDVILYLKRTNTFTGFMYCNSRGPSLPIPDGVFPHVGGGMFDNIHGRDAAPEEHFTDTHCFVFWSVPFIIQLQ